MRTESNLSTRLRLVPFGTGGNPPINRHCVVLVDE